MSQPTAEPRLTKQDRDSELERVFRSMGEPSWWILSALVGAPEGLAPFQIVRYVQQVLRTADSPIKRLDPGTLHYAIPRMEELGVIESAGERDVEVPMGHGATRVDKRPVWVITALGELALVRRARVLRALSSPKLRTGTVTV